MSAATPNMTPAPVARTTVESAPGETTPLQPLRLNSARIHQMEQAPKKRCTLRFPEEHRDHLQSVKRCLQFF